MDAPTRKGWLGHSEVWYVCVNWCNCISTYSPKHLNENDTSCFSSCFCCCSNSNEVSLAMILVNKGTENDLLALH